AARPSVAGIRLGVHPHQTRVVVDLTAAPDYNVFALADPPRIVIDLGGTELTLTDDQMPARRGRVAPVRAARPAPATARGPPGRAGRPARGTSRIALDLGAAGGVAQVQLLAGSAERPYRLVVDLEEVVADGGAAPAVADVPAVADPPTAPAAAPRPEQKPAAA